MQKLVANVNLKKKTNKKCLFFLSDLIPFNVLLGGLDGKQVYRYNYSFFLFGFENACFFFFLLRFGWAYYFFSSQLVFD